MQVLSRKRGLVLLDDEDETIGMEDIYEKIAGGNYGCSWDAFQAYKHLKLLGYIHHLKCIYQTANLKSHPQESLVSSYAC